MLDVIELLKLFTKALPPKDPRKHSITLGEDDGQIVLNIWLEDKFNTYSQSIGIDGEELLKDAQTNFDEIMVALQSDEVDPKVKVLVCALLEKKDT